MRSCIVFDIDFYIDFLLEFFQIQVSTKKFVSTHGFFRLYNSGYKHSKNVATLLYLRLKALEWALIWGLFYHNIRFFIAVVHLMLRLLSFKNIWIQSIQKAFLKFYAEYFIIKVLGIQYLQRNTKSECRKVTFLFEECGHIYL